MNPPQPCLDDYAYVTHLAGLDVVQGIALCGSHRQGISDSVSDLDLWIFVDDAIPLSEAYVLDHMLPTGIRQELLFEGRDDTLASHLVLNLVTEWGIVNLKVLHTGALRSFVWDARASLDPQFLEDLENYATMQLLYDPHSIFADYLRSLTDEFVTSAGKWLTPLIAQRYASLYWRSVYQGLFRLEPASWRHLMGCLVELLAHQDAVNAGRLPSPAKWLLSPRIKLPCVPALTEVQRKIGMVDATQRDHVLVVYGSLARVESAIWGQVDLPHGMWWHAVFRERLPNLVRSSGNERLADLAEALPDVFRATS